MSNPEAPLLVPAICGGASLGDEMTKLSQRIDPYGKFRIDTHPGTRATVSLGVGACCRSRLNWYLGVDRCRGQLATAPLSLGLGTSSDLRGAGVASLLGASVAIQSVLNLSTVPRILSAWNFEEGNQADPGPLELSGLDVGRTLMIGAGAVATGVVYWLLHWGHQGDWTIVDGDHVGLHNTNRGVLFFPDDAGWLGRSPRFKSECLAQHLPGIRHIDKWYGQAVEVCEAFDTVLVLANEQSVRTDVSHRNDPIQFQATTDRNWRSQLHRHIVGIDGCVRCRMLDIKNPSFKCGDGASTTEEQPKRPDAALPFLSLASGLMLVCALHHMRDGEFGRSRENRWDWDFRSTHLMADNGIRSCREDCALIHPPSVRREIASVTRWHGEDWLQPALDFSREG